jgi:hypothetical protein
VRLQAQVFFAPKRDPRRVVDDARGLGIELAIA